jgi:type IV pilus assembly protein PilO
MKEFLEQLRNIDPNDPGRWPMSVRIGAIAIVLMIATGLSVYYLAWSQKSSDLEAAQAKEQSLFAELETKARKAANLEAYKAQLKEMEQSFGAMLRMLPNRTEVPTLLEEISQTGSGSGLESKLFEPGSESPHEFYAEKPIKLQFNGSFHAIGNFVSGIAALPRIVTLHDISITNVGKGPNDHLQLDATAKTYRYLEDEEKAETKPADKNKPADKTK